MEEDANYLTGVIFGQLNAFCYVIKTGCKPVAMMPMQDRYLEQVKKTIEGTDGLKFYSEYLCEGWTTVYIYKHEYLLEVIKSSPSKPKTAYDHWVLGKMFGFSDEEIGKYIEGIGIS
ncbi:MAG TPA: hypothetical protein VIK72_17025 [Clostridiaceae bacterium]